MVVALVIFTLTLPALNALVEMGSRFANDAGMLSLASMKCSSQLAEAMVGALPLESTDWTPMDEPNWFWKLSASDTDVENVMQVQVSVKYEAPNTLPVQASLCRMVLDPDNRGSTIDRALIDAAIVAAGGSTSSSSATTSGTGTTGTTGSTGAATTGGTSP